MPTDKSTNHTTLLPEKDNENSRGGIQVIARAASILRTLRDTQSGMSLGQIAERVGLPRSTTYHLLHAMAAQSFVVHYPDDQRWGEEQQSKATAKAQHLESHDTGFSS